MKKHTIFFALTGSLFVMATVLMSQTTKPAATKPAAAKPASAAPGGMAASLARGKQVYLEQCLACHQADALGVSGMNPPLVKTKFVLGDKNTLVKIVLNGMKGIEVEGEDYHGVMAPHSDLTDQQIADELFLSPNTVSTHRTRILRKMNMKSNAELMHYAIAHHLVD